MSKFSERFKSLRQSRKLSQQELADKLKISKSSVNMYERGEREPGLETIENIADFFNVDMDYLLGKSPIVNRTLQSNISEIHTENIYNVPVFNSVSAGFGAYASDFIEGYIPTYLVNDAEADDYIWINVKGDSMHPRIMDGDRILVRRQTSVDSGSVAVLLLDGEEGLVKKVEYGPDWIDLISFNPEYPVKHFKGADVQRLQVVGLVKEVSRKL